MPQKFWAVRYLETILPKKRTVESIVSLIYDNMILLITYLLQFSGTFFIVVFNILASKKNCNFCIILSRIICIFRRFFQKKLVGTLASVYVAFEQ